MNPALLITLEYPPQVGGIATYLSRMVSCFPEGSIQVLAQKEPNGDAEVVAHRADMRSAAPIYRRRLVSRWLKPGWLPAIYYTEWLGRKEGWPSAVIVSHLLPIGLVAQRLKKLRQVPYCVILHGMDAALALQSSGRKREQAKRVLAGADLVVANSRFTANLAESLGAKSDSLMIVHPSPGFTPDYQVEQDTMSSLRERWLVKEDDFLVMSAGRLVERKGYADAIAALAELPDGSRATRLLIVGDGPDRDRLESFAKEKGVADRVIFTGRLPEAELAAAYALSDLFVMTPRGLGPDVEGFGIVYLEANLFGLPVIASRTGGVPDAVVDGQNGLLIDSGDVKGLAEAIERLRRDEGLRRRLGEAGRDRVVNEFHWSDQCRPLVAAVRKLGEGQT
jgi:phosphatidylinositol alpha-1,6-mannosyltransferase